MKRFGTLIILLYISLFSFAQTTEETDSISQSIEKVVFNDGPYIFIDNKELVEKKVVDGEVISTDLDEDAYPIKYKGEPTVYKDVEKVAALSDIHGQYDLAVEILKNNNIIDNDLNWKFGDGHFVIVGDIFDRGDKVTEVLWLIYKLEKQAEEAGGKVHYLLGNHEYMVMMGDNRYVNPKYMATAGLFQIKHEDLFGPQTVLGRWLRSKSTIVKINDDVFVHGGISRELLTLNFKFDKINKEMRRYIDSSKDTLQPAGYNDLYFSNQGPIWYRGYFYDNLPEEEITELLKMMKSDHIIVGHCSNEEVVQLYDKRIFGVDSSIKKGEYGEILFIEKDYFSKGTKDGERKEIEK